ncbi:MAG: metallophosphoesterase [Cellulosilyticaceae bacterium]
MKKLQNIIILKNERRMMKVRKKYINSLLVLVLICSAFFSCNAAENINTPTEIIMSIGMDATKIQSFNWYAPRDTEEGMVEVVEGNNFDENIATIYKANSNITNTSIGDKKYFEITIDNLKPNTTYSYRVGSKKDNSWSDVGHFTTEPEDIMPYDFLFITDSQSNEKEQNEIVANTLEKACEIYPRAKFIIHGGDHVEIGYDEMQWQWYLDAVQKTLLNIPLMPTVGNHDSLNNENIIGIDRYKEHFNLPKNGLEGEIESVYSFDYGDVHFSCLNTGSKNIEINKQMEWLEKDVKQANKKWNIVYMHKGPYLSQREQVEIKSVVVPVFDKLDIDVVLQGHDHSYMRTNPLYADKEDSKGTVYVMGNTSGYKFYESVEREYNEVALQPYEPMFIGVNVTPVSLIFQAFTSNGIPIDYFEVTK